MKYSSRFWLYAPISLVILLAAGAAIHWKITAAAFEKKLASLNHHETAPGITLDWTDVSVGGFPFRLDAAFVNFSARGQGAHGAFAWTAPLVAMHSLTYGRAKHVFEATGRQMLRWTDATGQEREVHFLPATLRASAITDARGLARFDLDILDAGSPDFTVGRFQIHVRRDPDGRDLDLMLKADAVKALGANRKQVQVYATLSKAALLMPLLEGQARWPDAAANWRAKGGAAKLTQIIAPGLPPDALLSALY